MSRAHLAVDVDAHADELHRARLERRTIAPLTGRVPGFDSAAAYAVQDAGIARRLADGEHVIGGKLGFTSRAMQRAMQVDRPNYGWLTDAMLVDDGRVELDTLIHPKVEPEVAFRLRADLRPPATAADVLVATGAVLPCLEVVDSRYEAFRFAAADNIADDSSAGRVVLGPPAPVPDLPLADVPCVLSVDDEEAAQATGAAALDDPAAAVAWMVNAAPRQLRAGDLVLSGGLTAPVTLTPGLRVSVDLGPVGTVALTVVTGEDAPEVTACP